MKKAVPVDHGWAWMVCLGSFITLFFMQGTVKSLGILLVQFIRFYQAEQGTAALALGVVVGTWSLLTPVVIAVTKHVTYRHIVTASGLFCCAAAVLTSWAPNIYTCIAVFGLLTGVGYACMLGPTIAALSAYFEKRISLATGLATAGGSIGQLIWPIFLTYLRKAYSLQGVLIVYGGCFLHVLIGAALMRPLAFYTETNNVQKDAEEREMQDLGKTESRGSEAETVLAKEVDVAESCPGLPQPEEDVNHVGGKELDVSVKASHFNAARAESTESVEDPEGVEPEIGGQALERSSLTWSLFRDPLFVSFALGSSVGSVAFFGFYHFLPAFCQDVGITEDAVALILFVTGCSDLAAHFIGGWFGDLHVIRRHNIVGICCLVIGLAVMAGGVIPSFSAFLAIAILVGSSGGVAVTVWPVVLRDFVGPARFPTAFGLSILLRGIFSVPAPYLLGRLRDVTGTYRTAFCVCGGSSIFVSVTCFLTPCLQRWRDRLDAARGQSGNGERLATTQS